MNNGGPAFPRDSYTDRECGLVVTQNGMSLRDYFAAAAMQGWLASWPAEHAHPANRTTQALAASAYSIADAMLAEREAK